MNHPNPAFNPQPMDRWTKPLGGAFPGPQGPGPQGPGPQGPGPQGPVSKGCMVLSLIHISVSIAIVALILLGVFADWLFKSPESASSPNKVKSVFSNVNISCTTPIGSLTRSDAIQKVQFVSVVEPGILGQQATLNDALDALRSTTAASVTESRCGDSWILFDTNEVYLVVLDESAHPGYASGEPGIADDLRELDTPFVVI